MTTGSGIIHQEMPIKSELLLGIQLWANLPASEKMTIPKYMEIKSGDISAFEEIGVFARIIAGNYMGYVRDPADFKKLTVYACFLL